MRIVFFGSPGPAARALESLIQDGRRIPAVVTQPDRPSGRSRSPQPPPVKQTAEQFGIPVIQPLRARGAKFLRTLSEFRPDVLAVVAYGKILPQAVLELPRYGAVNVHFSLLPELRGAAPVQWALANALEVTGVTTMLMNERMDEGDVLLQQATAILRGEHAPALQQRLSELGASLLLDTLTRLERGRVVPQAQVHAAATYAPILSKTDGDYSREWTAQQLWGRMRGFDPWPGVWAETSGARLRLITAEPAPAPETPIPVGQLFDGGAGLHLSCAGNSALRLVTVQRAGKRPMAARDALHGRMLALGDCLSSPGPA